MLMRVALGLCLMMAGCEADVSTQEESLARPARLITVGIGNRPAPLQFVGKVAAAHTVDLGFEIDGKLQTLPVREGEVVTDGQILARLDPERFDLALESARADHELAEKTLSRIESLRASGTVSQAELDEAMARAKLTGLAVKAAQKDLFDTVLRAPFDGRVTKRLLENFSPVARLTPVIRLAPTERVEVVAGVPEQLMANLNPAALQKAEVRFSADPERLFAARWLDYEGEASRDTQTYDVRFALIETPQWAVLPGMTATVLLSLATNDQAVVQIPMSALQSDATGNFFVWVFDPVSTKVAQRTVKLGIPVRDQVPVIAGLKIGEQVVAAGGAWLYAGMKVRPLAED